MNVDELKKLYKVSFRTRGHKKYVTIKSDAEYRVIREHVEMVWPEAYLTSFGSGHGGTFRLNPHEHLPPKQKPMFLKDPPVNSIVRLTEEYRADLKDSITDDHRDDNSVWGPGFYKQFLSNDSFVYLGELVNMKGHGIYAGRDGRVYWGFHPEDFEMVPEDDV